MPGAEIIRNRQAISIVELQRIQAAKRGEIPPIPTPPGVPRRIPEPAVPPTPIQARQMSDQLTVLERKIKASPFKKWKLEDDKVVSTSEVLTALQKNKNLIRTFLAQRNIVERNLAGLRKISFEGKHYEAYIDEKGKTVIKPPPGISDLENVRNIIKYSPPWVKFRDSTGKLISRKEAYNLIVRPEEEIIAGIEGIKKQIRTGDPVALWNYLTYSLGLLPADVGGVIADWAFTSAGLKTAEEHIRSQVELEKRTLKELKTEEGRLQFSIKIGMLLAAPYITAKAVGLGVGYIAGVAPRALPAVKFASQVLGAYVTGTEVAEITTLIQAGKHEKAASRGTELGIQLAIGIKAFGPAYRTGLIAGYRKRVLAKAITSAERTRINTIFDMFKAIDKMPFGKKTIIRLTDVEKLSADDVINLTKFLKSPEGKSYHIILGGSAANPIPGRMPHDIDMAIGKYRIPRPRFKGLSFERWETSRIQKFKIALGKYLSKETIDGMDISDAEKVGKIFTFRGKVEYAAARVRKPIKVSKEPFWRVSIKEQLERKLASMLAPAHEMRGKDWDDFLLLAKQKIDSDLASKLITTKQSQSYNTLLSKLTKYKPTIKDGKLIAPAKLPAGLEIEPFTPFERFLRPRVEKPVFVTKVPKFVPQMIPTVKRIPILTRILIRIIGIKSTAKLLDFLKPPEGEKLLSSFGMIPKKEFEPYKVPFYIPPIISKVKPTPTPYVTMITPTVTPTIAPPPVITPPPPVITPPPSVVIPSIYMPITPTVTPTVKLYPAVYKPPLLPRKPRKPPIKYGYHTWVKKYATKPKQRKWIQLSDKPMKEKQALGLGAKSVDESVARTFKIKKTTKPIVSKPHLDNLWYQKKHKFRKPIKAGKVQHKSPLWIEKSKHLIDSPGEFKGITVEGWKATQAKKQQKMFMYTGPPKRSKK